VRKFKFCVSPLVKRYPGSTGDGISSTGMKNDKSLSTTLPPQIDQKTIHTPCQVHQDTATVPQIDSQLTFEGSFVNTTIITSRGGTSAFLWNSRENMYLAISGDRYLTAGYSALPVNE